MAPTALGATGSSGAEFVPRLIALSPDRPMEYFELAEEISYEMPGATGRDLARHLLLVALELDRRSTHPIPVGRSVCLALADVATDSAERAWLLAMARSLTPAGELAPADHAGQPVHTADASNPTGATTSSAELAFALARFRAADPRPVRALLESGNALRILTDAGMPPGAAAELLELVSSRLAELRKLRTPDSDGRVERYSLDGVPMYRLAPATHGHPGPVLTHDQTTLILGAEGLLLGASPDSWAADAAVTMGQPVRDINPASLAAYFKVDPTLVYFVADPDHPDDISRGRWSGAGPAVPESEKSAEQGVGDKSEEDQGQGDDRRDEQLLR